MALKNTIKVEGLQSIKVPELGNIETNEIITHTINDVYIKIKHIEGTKDKLEMIVSYTKGKSQLWTKRFKFTPALGGINFIGQGYSYLKTLEEFSDAADC